MTLIGMIKSNKKTVLNERSFYLYRKEKRMINQILQLLSCNICLKIVALMIVLDSTLGGLRALKERKLNSNFGINGAIRKIAMLTCVTMLVVLDRLLHINIIAYVPEQILNTIGISKVGLAEFFSILFALYEAVSIMKNMVLCELPVPKKFQTAVQKFLAEMTEEEVKK